MFNVEPTRQVDVAALLCESTRHLEARLDELDLPFQLTAMEQLACLVPAEQVQTS